MPFCTCTTQNRRFAKTGLGRTRGNAQKSGDHVFAGEHGRQLLHAHGRGARRLPGEKKRLFWEPFYTQMIILPRQARDKHRESAPQRGCCLPGQPQPRSRSPRVGDQLSARSRSALPRRQGENTFSASFLRLFFRWRCDSCAQHDDFTKTGSGQTQRARSKTKRRMVTLCSCLVVVAVRETQPFRRRGKSRYGDAQNLPEQDAALGCGCVLETSKHAPILS